MRVRIAGEIATGPVVDLRATDVRPADVLEAIRTPDDRRVQCSPPGQLHKHVGDIYPHMCVDIGPALALAMRRRREETRYDRTLAAVERQRDEIETATVDLTRPRERLAAAEGAETALRERVARLGGRVAALQEVADGDPTAAKETLESAAAELAECETERTAAVQALDRARRRARAVRDAQDRRRQLTDRRENLRRMARQELLTAGWSHLQDAATILPCEGPGPEPPLWTGPEWTMALAIVRVGALDAPIIVRGDIPADAIQTVVPRTPVLRL